MRSKNDGFPRWVISGTVKTCPVTFNLSALLIPTYRNNKIVSGFLIVKEFQGSVVWVENEKQLYDQLDCWVDVATANVCENINPQNLLEVEKDELGKTVAGTIINKMGKKQTLIMLTNAERMYFVADKKNEGIKKIWMYKYYNEPYMGDLKVNELTRVFLDNGIIVKGDLSLANGSTVHLELISNVLLQRRMAKASWYIQGTNELRDERISLNDLKNVTINGDISITGDFIAEDGATIPVEKISSIQLAKQLIENNNNQPVQNTTIQTPERQNKKQKLNDFDNSPNSAAVLITTSNVSTINLHQGLINDDTIDDNHDHEMFDYPLSVSELSEAFKRSFLEEPRSDENTNQLVIQLIKTVTNGMNLESLKPKMNPYSFFIPDSHQPISPQDFLNNAIQQCELLCRVDNFSYLHAVDDILISIINNQDFSEKIGDFLAFQETVLSIIRDLPLDSRYQFDF